MARTAAQIQAEITKTETLLDSICVAGQSWEITSGTGAGTKRVVTFAEYDKVTKRLDALYVELDEANRHRGRVIRAGW